MENRYRNDFHRGGARANWKAHNITEMYLISGLLKRPKFCEKCGAKEWHYKNGASSIHAHHCDYNKPNEVMWLCKKCHFEWHEHNVAIPAIADPISPFKGWIGRKHREESKLKMSEAAKRRAKPSEESLRRRSESLKRAWALKKNIQDKNQPPVEKTK